MNKTLAEITRTDFPLLQNYSRGDQNLIYFDHAATSQKPFKVIKDLETYYSYWNANVHRGAHQLSAKATQDFEKSRIITANFVGSNSPEEIIFTRNATEAINLVSRSWGDKEIKEGDEIILTIMEHHSNLVPWQLLSERTGCILKYAGITESGELDIDDLKNKLTNRTKLISLVHISNVLGCCNPIAEVSKLAKAVNANVLVDACQSLAHQSINVRKLGIDFLVGSSHKLCGPTGIGFLWAKEEILEEMPPFLGGGEMIQDVFLEKSTWADLPHKFEAGTPAIGEAIGMGSALKYLEKIGMDNIQAWEKILINHMFNKLSNIRDLTILGPTPTIQPKRGALATFHIKGVHANDIAEILDAKNICIRSGHHCCQPLHRYYGIASSARASLSFTSTMEEIDTFVEELIETIDFLKSNS